LKIQNNENIDISNFANGMYLVKINNGSEFLTQKLIKHAN
jgi:hypothetical protein